MSQVRAKFKCIEKHLKEDGENIILQPVYGDSPENKDFFKYTPGGKIELFTINKSASDAFIPGKEYYVDFTLAE